MTPLPGDRRGDAGATAASRAASAAGDRTTAPPPDSSVRPRSRPDRRGPQVVRPVPAASSPARGRVRPATGRPLVVGPAAVRLQHRSSAPPRTPPGGRGPSRPASPRPPAPPRGRRPGARARSYRPARAAPGIAVAGAGSRGPGWRRPAPDRRCRAPPAAASATDAHASTSADDRSPARRARAAAGPAGGRRATRSGGQYAPHVGHGPGHHRRGRKPKVTAPDATSGGHRPSGAARAAK